jgi:hypothetical protein
MVEGASKQLQKAGFRVSIVDSKQPAVIGIIGKK